jgi:hypothetical protein
MADEEVSVLAHQEGPSCDRPGVIRRVAPHCAAHSLLRASPVRTSMSARSTYTSHPSLSLRAALKGVLRRCDVVRG